MMKRIGSFCLALAVALPLFCLQSFALPQPLTLYFHGFQIAKGDYPVIDGQPLVPMGALCELVGAECYWDEEQEVFTIRYKSTESRLTVRKMTMDFYIEQVWTELPLPAPAKAYEQDILVPLAAVEYALDLPIAWDEGKREAYVGVQEEPLANRPGWSRLWGHSLSGTYDILVYRKGSGNYLDYTYEATPLSNNYGSTLLTATEFSGQRATKPRWEWYQYFDNFPLSEERIATMLKQFGPLYLRWLRTDRAPRPERVAERYMEEVYGPMENDWDSSWCLAAAMETDGGYYSGYHRDFERDEDENW